MANKLKKVKKSDKTGPTELMVDLSSVREVPLKNIFPDKLLGYSELMTHFWSFIEKNHLSSDPLPLKKSGKT